jgi:hypothetical protein
MTESAALTAVLSTLAAGSGILAGAYIYGSHGRTQRGAESARAPVGFVVQPARWMRRLPDEAFGERVRFRRSHRCFDDLDAFAGEDGVEVAGELAVAVADQEAKRMSLVLECPSRCSETVSTVKKSTARMLCASWRMNARHESPVRVPVGPSPALTMDLPHRRRGH